MSLRVEDLTGSCPFCAIVRDLSLATVLAESYTSLAIRPLQEVVPGHFLVLPRVHVANATVHPAVSGRTMQDAARWVGEFGETDSRYESVNYITSVGRPATQSVDHLHIHVVPRAVDDGLALPWYSGRRSKSKRDVH